jgi:hypothetical protein
MKSGHDVLFKLGLGLQVLLIPIAFLWHFSSEANYYNWVLVLCLAVIIALFLWPQAVVVRLQRLRAIKLQCVLVLLFLAVSWLAYAHFYHVVHQNASAVIYSVNWEMLFGRRWVMLLSPGISILTALGLTVIFITLPVMNLYRYQLDKKRVKGIKKEDLFV